ncbi:hypothetical protein [Kitasatospora sp. MBT66]|uniref:hypothetical protein n=1 Tax=Kitasatospora sp. MBT66 TaxID=1444769 RepID=UPI0005BE27BB|nr:hypothetical protein [Kitasatospora sp. MBT66]
MKLRHLLDLLRRPTTPPDPPGPGNEEADPPSVYLTEPPAPDPHPDDLWCTWPDELDPVVQQAMDDATAAHRAAVTAWQHSEDPWTALHTQPGTTTP